MEQLSGLDASFLYFETNNAPMHIAGLCIYDPKGLKTDNVFEAFKDLVRSRLPLARTFRQRIVTVPLSLDHPYWIEDPNFDLDYHMRHVALPKPGDWTQLRKLTERLMARPLDRSRPLWEMYVIEGLDAMPGLPKGAFATFTKIHHAAVDGVSGAEITAAIHDLSPDAVREVPEDDWQGEPLPGDLPLLGKTYMHWLVQPFKFAEVVGRTVGAIAKAGQTVGLRKLAPPTVPFSAPSTRFNKHLSPHRVFDGVTLPLDAVKQIKNVVEGATVNDVILTICGGALRRYLNEKGELPEKPLVAMAPISVRGESEKGHMGNQVSAMLVQLATDVADPLKRLEAVREATAGSKEMTAAIGARTMTDYTQFIPSTTAALAARLYTRMELSQRHTPPFNLVITNVPGPQVPLYAGGAKLLMQYGCGPILDSMGLIMPVFSYNGTITVSAVSCRKIMPDIEVFRGYLLQSFEELCRVAGVGEGKSKPQRKTPARKTAARKTNGKAAPSRRPRKAPSEKRPDA